MDKLRDWPEPRTLFPVSTRKQLDSALDFLMSVRCFLHLRQGRDDNLLLWESQDEAAARRIGTPDSEVTDAAGWMRTYFGQARSVYRVCEQLLEEIPAAWSSLYPWLPRTRVRPHPRKAVRLAVICHLSEISAFPRASRRNRKKGGRPRKEKGHPVSEVPLPLDQSDE
jgi:UTP:GlnB (protein PII) uridylyltransferase